MDDARIAYRLGPVPRESAVAWLAVARRNIDRITAAGHRAPFRIPEEVATQLRQVLDGWDAATEHDPYEYEGSEDVFVARRLLTYWLNIVSLSGVQRDALGVEAWPPDATPFEAAVGRAILASLGADERLRQIWRSRTGS